MRYSSRTRWHRQQNRLSLALEDLRRQGRDVCDLTVSNPTACGIAYPPSEILSPLSQQECLRYHPHPRGLLAARKAVCRYYRDRNVTVDATHLILTASTSEAYSMVFKLLCEPGETILVPVPSYPLFEFLAQLNDVTIRPYHLRYAGEWHIDIDSVERGIDSSTKAIILVNPHNPTGMYVKRAEYAALDALASRHDLALIVDEVFADYPFEEDVRRLLTAPMEAHALTFTLNGIAKSIGLPQLKLGWLLVSGPPDSRNEALERLEIIADTFLSVNTPVQVALPQLLVKGQGVRSQIQQRVKRNFAILVEAVGAGSVCSVLKCEGGWHAILRVPGTMTDEEWALHLLENVGVYLFPGYFFEFEEGGYLVVSLLPETERFRDAVRRIMTEVERMST